MHKTSRAQENIHTQLTNKKKIIVKLIKYPKFYNLNYVISIAPNKISMFHMRYIRTVTMVVVVVVVVVVVMRVVLVVMVIILYT